MENKVYKKCTIAENTGVFNGYYEKYSIDQKILEKLSRDLGFSYEMYSTLNSLDSTTAEKLVMSMSKKSRSEDIVFLVDEDSMSVLGYSLDASRFPILNTDFIKRVSSLVETSSDIEISETYRASDDTISSVILKKVDPVIVDLSSSQTPYEIGVLIMNNELDSAYCRLVVFIDNQPIYLPASYYSASTNRFKKSTSTSSEALEVLVLKIIDELRLDELKYKIQDFHLKYRVNKDILTTYEEYNTLLRAMMKIPSIIDDHSFLESLNSRYDEFEKKYNHLADQKSSYIWRCTAIGDVTIGALAHITSVILNELGAPAMEYYNVRELLGNYLSTSRIAVEIAKEDK